MQVEDARTRLIRSERLSDHVICLIPPAVTEFSKTKTQLGRLAPNTNTKRKESLVCSHMGPTMYAETRQECGVVDCGVSGLQYQTRAVSKLRKGT